MEAPGTSREEQQDSPPALRALAEAALRRMILENKLSAGDLIKLLAQEDADPAAPSQGCDFTIRLLEE